MTGAHSKKVLENHGLAPSRQRGQNFLKHQSTARAIVARAEFSSQDHVLEVGVGLGALTGVLAAQVARVTGLEIDRGIVRYHEQERLLPANVELLHLDVLKADFAALHQRLGTGLKIISNLPYSISNPFIFKLIDNRHWVDRAVILLQKEMAQRLMAAPHGKDYGIPSVLLQSCARVAPLMEVGAAEFHPRPKVDSLLIRIDFDATAITAEAFDALRDTVRAAFSSRRKQLANNLVSALPFGEGVAADKARKRVIALRALAAAGLAEDVRAEDVTIAQYRRLAAALTVAA